MLSLSLSWTRVACSVFVRRAHTHAPGEWNPSRSLALRVGQLRDWQSIGRACVRWLHKPSERASSEPRLVARVFFSLVDCPDARAREREREQESCPRGRGVRGSGTCSRASAYTRVCVCVSVREGATAYMPGFFYELMVSASTTSRGREREREREGEKEDALAAATPGHIFCCRAARPRRILTLRRV